MAAPVRAEDVQRKRVDWLWENRIPREMISVIAGKPDTGKGLVAVKIGAEVSRAGGNVLHSAIEDSPELITAPRYEAAGADLSRIHLWRFRLPERFNELAEYIVQHKIDLLIIDPLASHLSGGITRHSDRIREVTDPLIELVEKTGTAVIVIEHVLKRIPANADPLSSIGGSGSGLPAATRMGFIFGVDPQDGDRRILCHVKGNICSLRPAMAYEMDVTEVEMKFKDGTIDDVEVPALLFEEECVFDAMRLLKVERTHGAVGRPADKRASAAEWLATYLFQVGTPVPAGKVMEDAKQFGMSSKTLRRAAADMTVLRNPPGGGRNCTWELDDETIAAMRGDDERPEVAELPQDEAPVVASDLDSELAALLGGESDGGESDE